MLTPNAHLMSELEEFEALLDDNEPSDLHSIKKIDEKQYENIQKIATESQVLIKSPKILLNSSKHLGTDPNLGLNRAKDFETKGPSFSGVLPPLPVISGEIRKKKCFTEYHKSEKAKPNIILTQSNEIKEENKIEAKWKLSLSNLREYNKDQQKASYNELISLFKDSTSQNPTRVFDDNPVPTSKQIISRRASIEMKEPTLKSPIETVLLTVPSLESKKRKEKNSKDSIQAMKEEEAIKNAQKTIESLVEAIQYNPSENYIESIKYESQKLEKTNWREISQYIQPTKVEIVVIDIVNFGLQDRAELILRSGYYQDIGSTVKKMVTEIKGLENEGKHVLIYLYNRQDQRKLFFSKFFFIIKNNNKFEIGLKNEKEIIMNYLLTLGIFEFKLKFEDKPISEEKLNFVKNKALSLVKGIDNSVSPFLCDWLSSRVRQQVFVEKYYINQNIKGKTDMNFMYNIFEYLTSTSSRFIAPSARLSAREKTFANLKVSAFFAKTCLSDSLNPYKKEVRQGKNLAAFSNDPLIFGDNFFTSSTSTKNKLNPILYENNSELFRQAILQNTPRTQSLAPQMSLSGNSSRLVTNSILSFTPREKTQILTLPKDERTGKRSYQIVNNTEFFDLNIKKPSLAYEKLNIYFKTSMSANDTPRGVKTKKSSRGYLGSYM